MIPIVVVAFNRPKSLLRLLNSLSKAEYEKDKIDLIISIDYGDNQQVVDVAENFVWKFGRKTIIYHETNLGLKKHVIECGSLSLKYGSIILLEDDLYVSKNFYIYTKQALKFSEDKEYIGGISLYNHQTNVLCAEPFLAMNDKYDNYYFQFASSWGQAWTAKQWNSFITWYDMNSNISLESDDFPKYISNWSSSSWLKYFIKYLVVKRKYFLYPKVSLSTNFGDKGTHVGIDNTNFQVPLENNIYKSYDFSTLFDSKSVYDVYYENEKLNSYLGIPSDQICIDLYGNKKHNGERYYLTRKTLEYKIIKQFNCSLRPHDANIIENIEGIDFTLYDTLSCEKRNKKDLKKEENKKRNRKVTYCTKQVTREKHFILTQIFIKDIFNSIRKKLVNIFN